MLIIKKNTHTHTYGTLPKQLHHQPELLDHVRLLPGLAGGPLGGLSLALRRPPEVLHVGPERRHLFHRSLRLGQLRPEGLELLVLPFGLKDGWTVSENKERGGRGGGVLKFSMC